MLEKSVVADDELPQLLRERYRIGDVFDVAHIESGSANCRVLATPRGHLFLKEFQSGHNVDDIRREPAVAEHLRREGVPTAKFIPTVDGDFVWIFRERAFCMREYVEGLVYGQNRAPDWLMARSAEVLADICASLGDFPGLPVGFSEAWLRFNRQQRLDQVDSLIAFAMDSDLSGAERKQTIEELRFKRALIDTVSYMSFDLDKFTVGGTHGDYSVIQLICRGEDIASVVDFSSACRMPYVWEVMRSFVLAHPGSAGGEVDIEALAAYFEAFCRRVPLSGYDLANAGPFFLFHQARSLYGYREYLLHGTENRRLLLDFAHWRTALCRWLLEYMDKLEKRFSELEVQPNRA